MTILGGRLARAGAAVRSMSTSTVAQTSQRAKRLAKQRHDEKLRLAVHLYHLTPSFYPTESQPSEAGELDDAVTESILGPFMGERNGRPFLQFSNTAELLAQQQQETQSARRDGRGELDVYESPAMQGAFVMKPMTASTLSTSDPETLRRHFVKQPQSYSSRRARDAAGYGDMFSQEEVTQRSAQVRDALYGTVGGELPGLEIIREKEREWKKEEQS